MENKSGNPETASKPEFKAANSGEVNESESKTVTNVPEIIKGAPLSDPEIMKQGRIVFTTDERLRGTAWSHTTERKCNPIIQYFHSVQVPFKSSNQFVHTHFHDLSSGRQCSI